jgi:hypothetical protein
MLLSPYRAHQLSREPKARNVETRPSPSPLPWFTGGEGQGEGGFKSSGLRRLAQQFGAPQKGKKCPLTIRVGGTNGFSSQCCSELVI